MAARSGVRRNVRLSTRWPVDQHAPDVNERKRDAFTVQDFTECGRVARLKGGRPQAIVREVLDAVSRWRGIADDAGVDDDQAAAIENSLRLNLPAR